MKYHQVTLQLKNSLLLSNPKLSYHVQNNPPLGPILSQFNPITTSISYLFNAHLGIIFPSTSTSPGWPITFKISKLTLRSHLSSTHAYMPHSSYYPLFYRPNNIRLWTQITKHFILYLSTLLSLPPNSDIHLSNLFSTNRGTQSVQCLTTDSTTGRLRFDARQRPLCPDRLSGPPSLLYNGYRGSFPRG
jgi:hypothetical protein